MGAALAYSALPLLIMQSVPRTETAAANSLNTLMRQLGTSTVTAVAAALGGAFATEAGGHQVAGAPAFGLTFTAAAVAALGALVIALVALSSRSPGAGLSDRSLSSGL